MAWSTAWPKAEGENVTVALLNELVAELNVRTDLVVEVPMDDFAEGDSLWDAIHDLRQRVADVLAAHFFINEDTGYMLALVEDHTPTYHYDWDDCIFAYALGEGRVGWRQDAAANETTSSSPPSCSLEDSAPYAFHLNELHDVIDALQWININSGIVGPNHLLEKTGTSGAVASKQAAIDDAWAALVADDVYEGAFSQNFWSRFSYDTTYDADITLSQPTVAIEIPAEATALMIWAFGVRENYFHTAAGDAAPPAWSLQFYIGTAEITVDADGWTYGALAGTLDVPSVVAPPISADDFGVELTGFSAGELNYIRQGQSTISTKPQYIVDDGEWEAADNYAEKTGMDGYRFVAKIV